uniref:Centriolin-like n=1 Tax=Scleropages formosus TaxID=113540 RepID=A0A8C9RML1_SCLFO
MTPSQRESQSLKRVKPRSLAVLWPLCALSVWKRPDPVSAIPQAHVKAQVSSKSQLLDMLSKRHHELEARLDHMLSRIAKETEEIKDLEQQLTDGQIAANEALKRDLEGIIAGLQEYLEGVKGQAFRAETECRQLQREKEALQRHLQDSEEQRNQLEMIIMDAEGDKELQRELRDLRVENAELRQSQGQISAYKAKLEAQLQEHNAEVERLKEELGRMRRFSQNEQGVLQAELEKERHGRENALAQVELAVEKDKERQELQDQLRMLRVGLMHCHWNREDCRTQQQLQSLDKELRDLKRSVAAADKVAALQLSDAKDQLYSMHGTVRKINKERSEVGLPHGCGPRFVAWDVVDINISVGSHGTQDSGLGLQYPPSPNRGQRGRTERGQPAAPPARGYWLYCPPHHGHSGTSRRGDSASEHHFIPPSGSAIYTVLPDGSPLPPGTAVYAPPAVGLSVSPGTVVCGPPPTGAPLVFGPPPSSLMVPLVHTGVLLCNMPGHQQMVGDPKERYMERKRKQRSEERVGANVQRLIEQRTDLEQEVQELRRAVSRLKALQGDLTSLVGELELEKSLWQHEEVLEEVQCVEKTLMHRRAELREADRLLMEAESELKDAREKTRQTLQRHTEAQKHLEDTERELEEMEARAQDTATQLVQASQTLRAVQGELQVLQRHREEQEQTLLDMKDMVSSQDMKFQDLCSQVNQATER